MYIQKVSEYDQEIPESVCTTSLGPFGKVGANFSLPF